MNFNQQNESLDSKYIKQAENGNYLISTLLFITDDLLLYKPDGTEINLNYQEAVILKMLLQSEQNFVSRKTIIKHFWEKDEEGEEEEEPSKEDKKKYNNRINTSMMRLRKALSTDGRIKISRRNKKGYKLYIE